jgi:hypothetical protein
MDDLTMPVNNYAPQTRSKFYKSYDETQPPPPASGSVSSRGKLSGVEKVRGKGKSKPRKIEKVDTMSRGGLLDHLRDVKKRKPWTRRTGKSTPEPRHLKRESYTETHMDRLKVPSIEQLALRMPEFSTELPPPLDHFEHKAEDTEQSSVSVKLEEETPKLRRSKKKMKKKSSPRKKLATPSEEDYDELENPDLIWNRKKEFCCLKTHSQKQVPGKVNKNYGVFVCRVCGRVFGQKCHWARHCREKHTTRPVRHS